MLNHSTIVRHTSVALFSTLLLNAHPTAHAEPPAEPATTVSAAQPLEQPVTVELITEHTSLQPGGRTRIGIHFEMSDGWHIYAEDPGDAGLPTKITWSTSVPGVTFGPVQWPKPEEFQDPGNIRTHGYTGVLVLASPLSIWNDAAAGVMIPVRADVRWLACKDVCIPGKAELELMVPVTSEPPSFSAHVEFFDHINN